MFSGLGLAALGRDVDEHGHLARFSRGIRDALRSLESTRRQQP